MSAPADRRTADLAEALHLTARGEARLTEARERLAAGDLVGCGRSCLRAAIDGLRAAVLLGRG